MKELLGKNMTYYCWYYDFRHEYDIDKLTKEYKRYTDRMQRDIDEMIENKKRYEQAIFEHIKNIQEMSFKKMLLHKREVDCNKKVSYKLIIKDVPTNFKDFNGCYYCESVPGIEIIKEIYPGKKRHLFFKRITELKKLYANIECIEI